MALKRFLTFRVRVLVVVESYLVVLVVLRVGLLGNLSPSTQVAESGRGGSIALSLPVMRTVSGSFRYSGKERGLISWFLGLGSGVSKAL